MRRIFQAAILVVALSAWPLWLAYQEEARRRAEAELRAAKAVRELEEERRHRIEAERRVPYDSAVSWLGPHGKRLVAAWEVLDAGQEVEVIAFAEAMAAGEPWPPCAVPEQPATRREGSSPPASEPAAPVPADSTSHADARAERIREIILGTAYEAVTMTRICNQVDLEDEHRDRWSPSRIAALVEIMRQDGSLTYDPWRAVYQATPAPAATETCPTALEQRWLELLASVNQETAEWLLDNAKELVMFCRLQPAADAAGGGAALLLRLWGEIDQRGRDELAQHAAALSRGEAWPAERVVDRAGLGALLEAVDAVNAEPAARHERYYGSETMYALAAARGRLWPWGARAVETSPEERAELFAEQAPTARDPQHSGDTEEQEWAADQWVLRNYGSAHEKARVLAEHAAGRPGRRRAQIRALHATASELAARNDGDWERGVIAFLAWLIGLANYPPGLSSAPSLSDSDLLQLRRIHAREQGAHLSTDVDRWRRDGYLIRGGWTLTAKGLAAIGASS